MSISRRLFGQLLASAPIASQVEVDHSNAPHAPSGYYYYNTTDETIDAKDIAAMHAEQAKEIARQKLAYERMCRGEFTEKQLERMKGNRLRGPHDNLKALKSVSPAAKNLIADRIIFETNKSRYMLNAKHWLDNLLGIRKHADYQDYQLPEEFL